MSVRCRLNAALLVAVVLIAGAGRARAGAGIEDAIKATYLYKFAPFVNWPSSERTTHFEVCYAGDDAVTALLPEATAGQKVNGMAISLRQIHDARSAASCRILYFANDAPDVAGLLQALAHTPVLTITNSGLAAQPHGIVAFDVVDNHVRFDVDQAEARAAQLSISSQLLDLAQHVVPGS